MPTASTTSPAVSARLRWLAALAPLVAAWLAYGGSLGGGFVYDDFKVFVDYPGLTRGDWWDAAFGPVHMPLANRPLACLSFAWNPTFGGSVASGYRVVNLGLHGVCALLLFSVTRRTLLTNRTADSRATGLACVVATLWACHPLGCDAVAYITQRTTLLMSLAFLGALWCVLRAAGGTAPRRWRTLAVVALAAGMASKEEFVAAPVLVALFDMTFLVRDPAELRSRVGFWLAAAATWLVLLACVLAGPSNPTVGYDSYEKVSAFEWLMTQASVLLHYLRLIAWPSGLKGIHDFGIVRDPAAAALPLAIVAGLFVATCWSWRRRPRLAWLWTAFFLLLGPTSSVMPIVTEVVAEKRMYLPMLAVLMPGVLVAEHALRRFTAGFPTLAAKRAAIAAVATIAVATAEITTVRHHAPIYGDADGFWREAYAANELANGGLLSTTILGAYADVVRKEGRTDEALALLDRAMQGHAKVELLSSRYAEVLVQVGRLDDAERVLRALVTEHPKFAPGLGQLAFLLLQRHERAAAEGRADAKDPRLAEAVQLTQAAYRVDPAPDYSSTLGMALVRQGRLADAEGVLTRVVREDPAQLDATRALGAVRILGGRVQDGIVLWREVLRRRPTDHELRLQMAQAHLQIGERDAARALVQEVLTAAPGHPLALRLAAELGAAAGSGR
ncbi:MAG: tetratricopeptide repeat protein [Planctomycetes bacterium]|nr:tetratricopeptide repeat protein [Planctomycetota bacterium]